MEGKGSQKEGTGLRAVDRRKAETAASADGTLSGSTRSCLYKFRGLELIGGTMRRRWRQVDHRLMRDPLIQALDDPRAAAGGSLGLGETDEHAKADEQDQHEHRAR